MPEREEREEGTGIPPKEITDENFPSLWKELDFRIEEANTTPNYINTKKPSPRLISFKLSKISNKEKILQAAGNIKTNLQRKPIRLSPDFSVETLKVAESERKHSKY